MLTTTYIAVLSLAFLSFVTTIIGVMLAIIFRKHTKGIVIGIGFSVGIMLLISFFELIPESLVSAGIEKTVISVVLGILVLMVLDFMIPHMHVIREKGKNKILVKIAFLVALGIILHDIPEGFAMANSYVISPSLGILVAIAILLHNIPEEFAMTAPIVLVKNRSFLFKAAFLSALAEPVGAILGLFAVNILPGLNPMFMSFAAGAMIFVSIHELIPLARRYNKTSLFLLGIVLSVVLYTILHLFLPG